MPLNLALKMAIMNRGTTQTVIAKRVGLTESRLSRIIHGHEDPTADEKKKIARSLRKPIAEVFPAAPSTEAAAS